MAGNSAKQELEGFKAKLSSEMSYAIKCYQEAVQRMKRRRFKANEKKEYTCTA